MKVYKNLPDWIFYCYYVLPPDQATSMNNEKGFVSLL